MPCNSKLNSRQQYVYRLAPSVLLDGIYNYNMSKALCIKGMRSFKDSSGSCSGLDFVANLQCVTK